MAMDADASPGVLFELVDQLEDNIDGLHEALQPILSNALPDTVARLPLLDKAKLYVLLTYAIESALFCERRLHDPPLALSG